MKTRTDRVIHPAGRRARRELLLPIAGRGVAGSTVIGAVLTIGAVALATVPSRAIPRL